VVRLNTAICPSILHRAGPSICWALWADCRRRAMWRMGSACARRNHRWPTAAMWHSQERIRHPTRAGATAPPSRQAGPHAETGDAGICQVCPGSEHLPSAEFSAKEVLEWYRLRWQIELVFKRLKSLAELGHLAKHDERSVRSWLYGNCWWDYLPRNSSAPAAIFPPGDTRSTP